VDQAEKALGLGFLLGIGGVATFNNGGLRPVISAAPRERIVLETDAPYLAPVPKRGKRNESAYLPHIATVVAGCWGIGVAEVGEITAANARQVFDLDRFVAKP
jgi:TatD DNase family protein